MKRSMSLSHASTVRHADLQTCLGQVDQARGVDRNLELQQLNNWRASVLEDVAGAPVRRHNWEGAEEGKRGVDSCVQDGEEEAVHRLAAPYPSVPRLAVGNFRVPTAPPQASRPH